MLVKEREGDDVAIGWRQCLLVAGHKPLHHIGPPKEKTMLDEALHACIGNIGVMPRIHGEAKAMAEERRL